MAVIKKDKQKPPATPQYFPIVGVGASAGGLDAFKRLLKAIPEDSGMAYVLVQHLDPTHESVLPDILSRFTKIPVHEITEDIHLAPDHIYIIPSNKILTSTDGVLKLSPRNKKILNLSIDVFFTSLADVHKELAVGVVLSGTGSDGTLGLKAIKEHGGITIAQDTDSSAYDAMPQSAINAGVVDFILAPENIPQQLLQINHLDGKTVTPHADARVPKNDDLIFKQILSLIRLNSGVDFTFYKQPTPRRRIARRMAICKTATLSSYLKLLRANKEEQTALFQDMLIPVTSFFRDTKFFKELSSTIIPLLLKNKPVEEPIRVWVAGCSTGEEAYSIAICIHECLSEKTANKRIQIFASDISEVAIKKARTGIYSKTDVKELSDERLHTYFIKNNNGFEVSKVIRDMCVFAPQNFLKDPPFAKMDLISCRNSLIYMDSFLQKKALATFHYALNEKGFLLLGKSETTGTTSDLFSVFDKHEKIYSRKHLPGRFMHVATEKKEERLAVKSSKLQKTESSQTDFRKSAEAMLLTDFTPAGVIVDEQLDVVHIHGAMTPYLEQSPGKPTFNLLKMAREGLAFELRSAVHKAKISHKNFSKENIPVILNAKQSFVNIQVVPLMNTVEPHYFILFNKTVTPVASPAEKGKITSASEKIRKEAQLRIEQVENEMAQTREDMRSITEDQEAANEELQSANEELLSSSEEMQSLNEELETSKEELQSTNEELLIVNQELLDKQEQLNAARFYAEAIVTTMREPLVVLDKLLRIKTANASFYKKFNVEEKETEGKLFYEVLNHQFDDTMLRSLLEKILPQKNRIEGYEINLRFPTMEERTLLLNARQIVNEKTAEQLILLALEDITEETIARKQIEASEQRFSNILSQSLMNIAIFKGPEMVVEFANEQMLNGLGKGNAVLNKPLLEGVPELKDQVFPKLLADVYTTGVAFEGYETKVVLVRNGIPVDAYFNFVYQPYRDIDGAITGVTVLTNEVTEQVLAKKRVEESEKKFRTLSETIPNMIWSATADGEKNFFNKYFLDYTGLSFEELTGDGMRKIVFPADLEKDLRLWNHSLKTGEDFNMEKRIRHHDGTYRWHLSHGRAQKDELGNITGWIGSNTEIEVQKKFTEELEIKVKERTSDLEKKNLQLLNINEELHQTNLQLDQFTHIASHDLQEPLRKIITFSSRLQENHKIGLSPEVKIYLNKIESSSMRMTALIKDLLNYSRLLQHEKLFAATDLNVTLKNILLDFEMSVEEKKATIKSNVLPVIDAIPLQMNQLFYNLISNAIKFSKTEVPPVITITAKQLSEKDIKKYPSLDFYSAYWEIIFKDNGIGFDQKYGQQIFTIFQRLHSKDTYLGTGIGLALSKKIIENHHGEIFAESKEDEGASFHIILPLKQPYTLKV